MKAPSILLVAGLGLLGCDADSDRCPDTSYSAPNAAEAVRHLEQIGRFPPDSRPDPLYPNLFYLRRNTLEGVEYQMATSLEEAERLVRQAGFVPVGEPRVRAGDFEFTRSPEGVVRVYRRSFLSEVVLRYEPGVQMVVPLRIGPVNPKFVTRAGLETLLDDLWIQQLHDIGGVYFERVCCERRDDVEYTALLVQTSRLEGLGVCCVTSARSRYRVNKATGKVEISHEALPPKPIP